MATNLSSKAIGKRLQHQLLPAIDNASKTQGIGWRVWLREKLERIEEVRKYPQPELRAEINRQVQS